MYRLTNVMINERSTVTVVGCGGTGGFVAEGLCRLMPQSLRLLLIDCDRLEERNLGRSNFTMYDLDLFKSEALAKRLASRYNRPIAYSTLPVGMVDLPKGLVIGCVDNGEARRQITDRLVLPSWWIDSGNGKNYGQVLVGNRSDKDNGRYYFEEGICFWLPLPTIQQPALLNQEPRRRSCDEAVAADEQGPTINQAMAALVLEFVRRLIEGNCTWMQLYLDLDAGMLHPVMASPELVAAVMKKRIKRLVAPEKGGEK